MTGKLIILVAAALPFSLKTSLRTRTRPALIGFAAALVHRRRLARGSWRCLGDGRSEWCSQSVHAGGLGGRRQLCSGNCAIRSGRSDEWPDLHMNYDSVHWVHLPASVMLKARAWQACLPANGRRQRKRNTCAIGVLPSAQPTLISFCGG